VKKKTHWGYALRAIAAPKELYDVAKKICFEAGLPWTDPRTGKTYRPPRRSRRKARGLS